MILACTMILGISITVANGTRIVVICACTMIIGFAGDGDTRASRPHESDTIFSVEDDVAVNGGDPIAARPSLGSFDGLHGQEAYFSTMS